ncbi:MAG: type IX secretion system membrane protein PorP/SprF [Bacteroidales bacterium]|nr:type IX secretion system membrane protein PorP/SprF [Bacteroidales bacterium]
MKKIVFTVLLIVISPIILLAQNDILFSHYMFNEITFNPAVAGSSPTLDASILARQQWIGFDEAPSSQVLNAHSFVRGIGGVGLNIINDRLGFENTLNLKLMYAHHMQVSRTSLLSLGASVGIMNKTIDGTKLIYEDENDLSAIYSKESRLRPDFSFGAEFNTAHLTVGLSSTHIEQSLGNATLFKVPRHYYAYAKYRIEASSKLNIVPTFLVKSSQFITQLDLSAIFFYDNKFWLGGAYRLDEAFIGIIGFNITKDLKFSYSYDYSAGPMKTYNDGSHEVMVSYSIGLSQQPLMSKSPRYFN